jgi:predicted PurR-regulated permease PerM
MAQEQTLDISWEAIAKVFIAVFVFYIIYLARTIALWFLFGLAIAILLEPAIQFFRRAKLPKIAAILVVYFAIFGVLGLLIYLSAPIFINEIKQFAQFLPSYFNEINPFLKQAGISAANSFNEFASNFLGSLTDSSSGFFASLEAFFGGITAAAFIFTIAFFLSLEDRGPERFLSLITPRRYEDQIVSLFEQAQHKIAGWFGARIVACLFVGIASFVVFYLFGLPYKLSLAGISGLLNFIPYIGQWAALFLIIGVAAVTTKSWAVVIYVAIALTAVQEIELKLLTPLLMKKMINVPPVVVLLSLLVGTTVFGFLGAIFAVPVFGILFEFTKDMLEKRKEEPT